MLVIMVEMLIVPKIYFNFEGGTKAVFFIFWGCKIDGEKCLGNRCSSHATKKMLQRIAYKFFYSCTHFSRKFSHKKIL